MLLPGRLRSRLIVCVMAVMALGAHRGRPVAAAPCTPGLRPATSPLCGAFDLSLQASGRAEAASLQNTALSPHPCGLPRPSGNVSAMLRPPAPAVSAAPAPAVIWAVGRVGAAATRHKRSSVPDAIARRRRCLPGLETVRAGRVGRIRRSRHPAQRRASVRPDTAAPRRRRYNDGAARRKGCP